MIKNEFRVFCNIFFRASGKNTAKLQFLSKNLFVLILFTFISCNEKVVEKVRYRERNPIEVIEINMKYGNIIINGWNETFIDITTEKVLEGGIKSDIALLTTDITSDQENRKLILTARQPDRVDGRISFILYIPHTIETVIINTVDSNTIIKQYLGNVIYNSDYGEFYLDFYGSSANINTKKSNVYLYVNPVSSFEIMLRNNYGDTFLTLEESSGKSFIDAKSLMGNINLFLNKNSSIYAVSNSFIYNKSDYPDFNIFDGDNVKILSYSYPNPLTDIFIRNDDGVIYLK